MATVKITLPNLHQAQRQIKTEAKRFNVIDCGRRFGKNVLLQDLAITTSLHDKQPAAWAAPQYRQLQEDWKELTNTLAPVITRQNEQIKQIEIIGGGVIDFWSLDNANAIRGRKYKRFLVNEAGLVVSLLDDWQMVIRPTLMDYGGDAFFAGALS